eukprot:SM000115S23917  [mRNA]  locus=s115:204313:206952:+ [translate_table: standard]
MAMVLYHSPWSASSHKARLALEEKAVDYTPAPVNVAAAANLAPDFVRRNHAATVPVLVDGPRVICDARAIAEYADAIDQPLGHGAVDRTKVNYWLQTIEAWDVQMFAFAHYQPQRARALSKFKRRVCIARMAQHPELGPHYSKRLQYYQDLIETCQSRDVMQASERQVRVRRLAYPHAAPALQLVEMLDAAEVQLRASEFLAGEAFSMADACFVPIPAMLESLDAGGRYLQARPNLLKYFQRMKERPSYQVVIGQYSGKFLRWRTEVASMMAIRWRSCCGKF